MAGFTDSPISVIGMGQCGSNIAFGLSVEIDPLAPIMPGTLVFKAYIDYAKKLFSNSPGDNTRSLVVSNEFYIGDMNSTNEKYISHLKAEAMRQHISNSPSLSFENVQTRLRESHPNLTITSDDENIFQRVKERPDATNQIELLSFRRDSQDSEALFYSNGSGGIQFLSEYLATNDNLLFQKLSNRKDGTFIGVFALGGGTGAGSVFGLLKKIKQETARYTLGLGILPKTLEDSARQRSGRFVCRFLSHRLEERFDTLLLFSNKAAMVAASRRVDTPEKQEETALSSINTYLTQFLYLYSLINKAATQSLSAKRFDPADGRSHLYDPCSIGMGVEFDEKGVSPRQLFIDAISPARFQANILTGLGISFGDDFDEYQRIRDILSGIAEHLESSDGIFSADDVDPLVDELNSLTDFYATTKKIFAFFFCKDKEYVNQVNQFEQYVPLLFDVISTGKVELTVFCYHGHYVTSNSVQVLCSGGISDELMDYFLIYIRESFFSSDADSYETFFASFMSLVDDCYSNLSKNDLENRKKQMREIVMDSGASSIEELDRGQKNIIETDREFRELFESSRMEDYMITKEQLCSAAERFVELAALPPKERKASDHLRARRAERRMASDQPQGSSKRAITRRKTRPQSVASSSKKRPRNRT